MSINNSGQNRNDESYVQMLSADHQKSDHIDALGHEESKSKYALCFGCNCLFTPKCCCICCTTTTLLLVLITCLVVFLSVIPNMAQEATDSSSMTVLRMHLSNVTNNSVLMNVSMQLSNSGSVDATIKSTTTSVYFENPNYDDDDDSSNTNDNDTNTNTDTGDVAELLYVGTMELPDIHVTANEGAKFVVFAPMMVENVTNFRVKSLFVFCLFLIDTRHWCFCGLYIVLVSVF